MDADSTLILFRNLAVALAIGLLIGLERGWQKRDALAGMRVAGLRTFAIIGLTGGVAGQLTERFGPVVLAFATIALAAMLIGAHVVSSRRTDDFGITSEVAALATFLLAALATAAEPALGAAGAVVVATLLGLKPELHRWLARLDRDEMIAALKLLLISALVLPVLPDRGMGPWGVLNPYQLWWLVVLVAAISFAGHFAVRVLGQTRGILATGVFGGLASSTALTLHFARLSRRSRGIDEVLAIGIVLAVGMSMLRMLLVLAALSPPLARSASPALLGLMAIGLAGAGLLRLGLGRSALRAPRRLGPPFRLKDTLRFAVLLIVITLAAQGAHRILGGTGVLAIAALAAIGDLTAATLSITQLAQGGLDSSAATRALVVAATTSVIFKSFLAFALGGRRLGLWVGASALLTALAAAVLFWLLQIGALPF